MLLEAVLEAVPGVEAVEVIQWVERGWVRAEPGEGGALVFQEIDIARCRLIVDLRRDMGVNEEAVPVVLGLIDQVYDLRRRLRALAGVLGHQPEDVRASILHSLGRSTEDADRG
jgi:chaperone modulatory protein CbpM